MKRVEKSWMRGSLSVFPKLGAKPCPSRLPVNEKGKVTGVQKPRP